MRKLKTQISVALLILMSFYASSQCNVQIEALSTNAYKYSMSEMVFKEDPSEPYFFVIIFSVNAYLDKSKTGVNFMYELVPTFITDWQEIPTPNVLRFELQTGKKIYLKATEKSFNTINGRNKLASGTTSIECRFYPSATEISALGSSNLKSNIVYEDYRDGRPFVPPTAYKGVISEMIKCVSKRMLSDRNNN